MSSSHCCFTAVKAWQEGLSESFTSCATSDESLLYTGQSPPHSSKSGKDPERPVRMNRPGSVYELEDWSQVYIAE